MLIFPLDLPSDLSLLRDLLSAGSSFLEKGLGSWMREVGGDERVSTSSATCLKSVVLKSSGLLSASLTGLLGGNAYAKLLRGFKVYPRGLLS